MDRRKRSRIKSGMTILGSGMTFLLISLFLFFTMPCCALLIDEAALLAKLPPSVAEEVQASAVEGREALAEDAAMAATGETAAVVEAGDKDLSSMSIDELAKTAQDEMPSGEETIKDIAIEDSDFVAGSEADELANMSMDDLRNEALLESGMDPGILGTGLGSTADLALMGAGGAGAIGMVGMLREVVGRVMDGQQLKMMMQRGNMMAGQYAMDRAMGGGMMMGPGMSGGMMHPGMGSMGGMDMMGRMSGVDVGRYRPGGGTFGRMRM